MKTLPIAAPLALFFCSLLPAQTPRPLFNGIGIEQKLNAAVPLDLEFRDESGATVPLRTYFGQKPVLLVPVYFRCPMLCSQVLSGVVAGLRPLSIKPGRDFEIIAVSFDPQDTPAEAAKKRDQIVHSYSSRAITPGWHFLTGDQNSIQALMQAIGFRYRYDPVHQIFVHASGVMVLTPDGHLARYLYGVDYEPKDLKLSLIEASHDRIGSPVDQVLLFCYHYDPKTGKYGAVVINLLRGAGVLMIGVLAIAGWFLWRRDLREHRA
ncbi:MAG TPA: SCO family protein [Bryobacteraceae bacterium]|jgi:protein SCO1/2|nr:SCO family protein [Bryobacteraceae bacterium]